MTDFIPDTTSEFTTDTRAISELIGYVLGFSIIVVTVVLVSISAGPVVDSAQSSEATTSMEQSLIEVDSEVQNVYHGTDFREFEAELPAGQFKQLQDTEITIEQGTDVVVIETRPLHYETQSGGVVTYEAGFIATRSDSAPVDAMGIQKSPGTAYMSTNSILAIPVLQDRNGVSTYSSSRSVTESFRIEQQNTETSTESTVFEGGDDVTITIDTDIPFAWAAFLENHDHVADGSVSVDDDTQIVEATIELDADDQFTVVTHDLYLSFD